ncbi:MAG: pilus assembly protein [Chloroflexi bacterium RBG_13_50_10]|jgi:type IV pilus assembly protein PilC|nr:MAG: pilus assembly protein [Chloroflexi bacterium RBG_13_50_10]
MNFAYTAYTEDKRLVRGRVTAVTEEAATELLSYVGYRVVTLKGKLSLINKEKLFAGFARIKPADIVMFSRQLALLLESGTDIVTSLDLLQNQVTNQTLRKIVGEVASDIRGGSPMSTAMSKHPRAFSQIYHRAISAGEQGGNLEIVLRQMADYIEKSIITQKQIKGALTYPIIVFIVAIGVVAILVTKVFPTFAGLYSQFGAELPAVTRLLIGITEWTNHYFLYLVLGIVIVVAVVYMYIRTPGGKYRWNTMLLRLPVFGRIVHLSELSRCCRTMAMLVKIGLPLPEVMAMAIHTTSNKYVEENLTGVQQELIRGEGLSQPMAKRSFFLPLMTQMVKVGEETGNLETTLSTVATDFEMESGDKTKAAVALITPAVTIFIGLIIGFVVLAMFSAMYSVYGQLNA